jgi:hypothetical protein
MLGQKTVYAEPQLRKARLVIDTFTHQAHTHAAELYPQAHRSCLAWPQRLAAVVGHVAAQRPDVLCLQVRYRYDKCWPAVAVLVYTPKSDSTGNETYEQPERRASVGVYGRTWRPERTDPSGLPSRA